jgi:hypothetical protein
MNQTTDLLGKCLTAIAHCNRNCYRLIGFKGHHSNFFDANSSSLIQMRGIELPVGNQSQQGSGNGKYSIEHYIPGGRSSPARRLGWLSLILAYICGPLAAWRFYCGRWKSGVFIFIVAGILAHAGLSLLVFGGWIKIW